MKHYQTAGRAQLVAYLAAHAAVRPQSAGEICAGLSASGHAPGNSSVYRLISALCKEGCLRRAKDAEGGAVYQYVGNGGESCRSHFHLQCTVCGRATHLTCDCGAEIAGMLAAEHGFAVDSGKTVFYGVCVACTKAKNAGEREGKNAEAGKEPRLFLPAEKSSCAAAKGCCAAEKGVRAAEENCHTAEENCHAAEENYHAAEEDCNTERGSCRAAPKKGN